jgi:hypothetical protein
MNMCIKKQFEEWKRAELLVNNDGSHAHVFVTVKKHKRIIITVGVIVPSLILSSTKMRSTAVSILIISRVINLIICTT